MAYLEKESQESKGYIQATWWISPKRRTEVSDYTFIARQGCIGCPFYRIRKSLIYQSFVLVKQLENESTSGRDRPSYLFIVPLRSIGEEHINSNDFDLSVKGFEKNVDVLNEMKNNNFRVIYLPFRWASFVERLRLLRVESTALKRQLSLIVVDESHTVETWLV